VAAGQRVGTIEARKRGSPLASPVAGIGERVAIPAVASVRAGDLVLVVSSTGAG